MLLALLIISAVWSLTIVMVVSLCVFAKRGDEAMRVSPTLAVRRIGALRRTRGAHACDAPIGAVQR